MALSFGMDFEIRTTGAADNGGGYIDAGGASADYSQQDAAQLTITDLAGTTGSVTVTSATGGFTAAMVGNVLRIASGVNFTVGFYEIKTYVDGNTITLDRTPCPAGDGAGGNAKVGGALTLAALVTLVTGTTKEDGYRLYIKAGSYNLTGNIYVVATGGFDKWEGYNATRGDNPTGTDRPLFTEAGFFVRTDYGMILENIRFHATGARVIQYDYSNIFINCSFENPNAIGAYMQDITELRGQVFIDCDFIGGDTDDNTAFGLRTGSTVSSYLSTGLMVMFCRFQDWRRGIHNSYGKQTFVMSNLFVRCTEAGYYSEGTMESSAGVHIHNNYFACGQAIVINGPDGIIMNNLFDSIPGFAITKNDDDTDQNMRRTLIRRNNFIRCADMIRPNQFQFPVDGDNSGYEPGYDGLATENFSLAGSSILIDLGEGIKDGVS